MTAPARIHRRLVSRAHAWLAPHEEVLCPRVVGKDAHELRIAKPILGHGIIVCSHRPTKHSGRCGANVYVMQLEDGNKYVALIEPSELRYLENAHMSVEETLAYLTGSPVSAIPKLRRIASLTVRTQDP